MTSQVRDTATVFRVSAFAEQRAKSYGKAIGRKPKAAARKLRAILQAFLNTMEIGEEEVEPIPRENGKEEIFIFKKVGKHQFSVKIREGILPFLA